MDSVGLGADGTMTREEIQKQIQEREKAIRGYQLDLKEADLNIRSIEKTLENQTVKSTLNGVVKLVSDPENTSGQDPLVQVVSSEGLYIQGTLPENQLEQMQTGQILSGYCYDNGVSFTAQVKKFLRILRMAEEIRETRSIPLPLISKMPGAFQQFLCGADF